MEMMSAVRPLETFVPPRAAGQRDVLSLALPPMPLLRVAFVGVGARGRMAVTRWCHIPKVEIAAVCDVSKEVTEEVARHVEQLGSLVQRFIGVRRLTKTYANSRELTLCMFVRIGCHMCQSLFMRWSRVGAWQ